jgi:hypothetical protein
MPDPYIRARQTLALFYFFFDALFFFLLGFGGIFAPALLASLKPIAIACFRLFAFFRPPDFNWPCLYSCMVFFILLRTVRFDFAPDPVEVRFLEEDFLAGMLASPSIHWREGLENWFQCYARLRLVPVVILTT